MVTAPDGQARGRPNLLENDHWSPCRIPMLSRVASADFDAELFLSASATLFAVVSFSYAVKDVFGELVPAMLAARAPLRPAPAPRPAALLALGTVYFAVGASALLRSRVFVTFIGHTRDATVLP